MWSTVLVVALIANLNPVRLGLALLVMSRPRPVQNLFVFWVGCVTASLQAMVIPLALLHGTPMFKPFADYLATNSATVRLIRIGTGVLLLLIAAVMISHSITRRLKPAHLPAPSDDTWTSPSYSNMPPGLSRLLGRTQGAPADGGSVIRRLVGGARNGWKKGSLWVAFVIGYLFGAPEPDKVLFLLTVIATSGAAVGTQISAGVVYTFVMLGAVEIIFVSCLAAPTETQAIVQRVHDWAVAHRRTLLVALLSVGGVALVATGMAG